MNPEKPNLTVILPVYNEAGNIEPLFEALRSVLDDYGKTCEIIFCDDGSTDGSREILKKLAETNSSIKPILLRRNFGQTAAIAAGVDHAQGDIIILMDADQQNDPLDIPKLLEKIDEGYDIVSGWRKNRQDPYITSVLPSKLANWIISKITGVKLHDQGCTLKAYRKEILNHVSLYGEMHRFITILGSWIGAKVAEVEVNHHPRISGKSKYSIIKSFKVLLDLPLLVLLGSYLTRPMHFFGTIGGGSTFLGFLCALWVLYDKITDPTAKAHNNPLLLLAVFFALVGIQILMIGLLAEMMTRVYHESQQKKIYFIEEKINFTKQDQP